MEYAGPRYENHIMRRSPSRTTHGRAMAYSSSEAKSMQTCCVGRHARPSSDSAWTIRYSCRGPSGVEIHLTPDAYHMRQRPPSTSTQGDVAKYGSASLRPTTGADETRSNVRPPSSLTAQPMNVANGTVTPRLQPM